MRMRIILLLADACSSVSRRCRIDFLQATPERITESLEGGISFEEGGAASVTAASCVDVQWKYLPTISKKIRRWH